jgi:hypothetical protein
MYSFNIFGHPKITSKHKTTIEFTKDNYVTKSGDCIVGIKADFNLEKLKQFTRKKKKIEINIKINELNEEITALSNPGFNHKSEIVIRKSNFVCKRTFAVKADKASGDIDRGIINQLKNLKTKAIVIIK